MSFRMFFNAALVGTALAAASGAQAQEAAADPAQEGPIVAATYNDWEILCNQPTEGNPQVCEMYQLLKDSNDSPIAEVSIAVLPLGAEFAAGATFTTPLETFLPTGLGLRIGESEELRVEGFRVCTVVGCIVRMGLSADEVDALKAGSTATVLIAPFVAPDRPVQITMSLSGFTRAYEDLQTRLSEAAAAARANQ
ncbi:MAG: hypothetical protein Kow0013_26750 [Pararhodobacter sp.]